MKLIHKKRFLQGFIKIDLFVQPLCKYILNKRLSFSSGILMMKFLHFCQRLVECIEHQGGRMTTSKKL